MEEYEIRTTALSVMIKGDSLFEQSVIEVKIADEAAGEFVVLRQVNESNAGEIRIDPAEWPTLREAIDRMVGECRDG